MKIIKSILAVLLMVGFLFGCSENKPSFVGPDPEKVFEGCEITIISEHNDIISYDGFEITSDNPEILEKLYKKYIELCEEDTNYPVNVYSSEIFWTHENKEGTKQLTANYDSENNLVEIFVKNIGNEEGESRK